MKSFCISMAIAFCAVLAVRCVGSWVQHQVEVVSTARSVP